MASGQRNRRLRITPHLIRQKNIAQQRSQQLQGNPPGFAQAVRDEHGTRQRRGAGTVWTGFRRYANPLDVLQRMQHPGIPGKGGQTPTHSQVEQAITHNLARMSRGRTSSISPTIQPYLVQSRNSPFVVNPNTVRSYDPSIALAHAGQLDITPTYGTGSNVLDPADFQYDTDRNIRGALRGFGQEASLIQNRPEISLGRGTSAPAGANPLFNVDVRGELNPVARTMVFAADTEAQQVLHTQQIGTVGRIQHVGLFTDTNLNLSSTRINAADVISLRNQGYSIGTTSTGLDALLSELNRRGARTIMRQGELISSFVDRGQAREVSIPLFSRSLGAGNSNNVSLRNAGAGEYMFKGGSGFSVTAQVAELGTQESKLHLQSPRSFSAFFYDELLQNLNNHGLGKLNSSVSDVLNLGNLLSDDRATRTAGFTDPLSYSGDVKLGRHHLGHSQQILLEINDAELRRLLTNEKIEKARFATARVGERGDISSLENAHRGAKEAVLNHLKTMEGRGGREADLAKKLNFALASQSGEWLFQDTINRTEQYRDRGERIFLKMTTADVKQLTMLPSQELFQKGRQFYLSRAAVSLTDVRQLPAAVSGIMGYNSKAMKGLRHDVRALGGTNNSIALSRRAIGLQFASSGLNQTLFGDSAAMMSENLIREMDRNPITGQSRMTITSKLNLRSSAGAADALNFQGILRSDLAGAISAHANKMNNLGRITFDPNIDIPLIAHAQRTGTSTRGIAPGINIAPDGRAVLGESTREFADIRQGDLGHVNDMMRAAQKRGMDINNTFITGARLIRGSNQLELTLSEKGVTTVRSGYTFGGQRISSSGVISSAATDILEQRLKINAGQRGAGVVFGDLGLEPSGKPGKQSAGFFQTLVGNLAEIISEKESRSIRFDANGNIISGGNKTKKLLQALGGTAELINIGGSSKLQFAGLGSGIENTLTDNEFGGILKNLLANLDTGLSGQNKVSRQLTKASFIQLTNAEIQDMFKHMPGFNSEAMDDAVRQMGANPSANNPLSNMLEAAGLRDVARAIRTGGPSSSIKHVMIKSIGGDFSIRAEEPLARFGADAVNIRSREAMIISESLDFARNQAGAMSSSQVMASRSRLFKSLIDAHPHLFKKNGELSLLFQQDNVVQETRVYKDIKQTMQNANLGEVRTLTLNNNINAANNTTSFQIRQAVARQTKIANVLNMAGQQDGKVTLDQLKNSILGVVDQRTGVAKISETAIMVQGPNGPMMIPSAKMMGFQKEEGFLRIPGEANQSFTDIETKVLEKLKSGQSPIKETKALYLNLLQDVEQLEQARLNNTEDSLLEGMQGKLSRLIKIMGTNTLSKQGLFNTSELKASRGVGSRVTLDGVDFGASQLRLQQHASLKEFEVGVTESTLKKMVLGGRLEGDVNKIDDLITKARQGNLYVHTYREPIASGRQMLSLNVKLLRESDLTDARGFNFDQNAFLHTSLAKYVQEGDHDKDTVNIFRLSSMDDSTMKAIHDGQKADMEGIVRSLQNSRAQYLRHGLTRPVNVGDVAGILDNLGSGMLGTPPEGSEGARLRNFTFDAMMDIVDHGHGTPIIEAHFRGRSYVDHMMSQIIDIQSSAGGNQLMRDNLLARLGAERATQTSEFLDRAANLFVGSNAPGSRGGRFATYHYTDVRNLTKYMFLEKAGNRGGSGANNPGRQVLTELLEVGRQFKGDDFVAQNQFMNELLDSTAGNTTRARGMVDRLSGLILEQANITANTATLSDIDPKTLTLLHNLAGQSGEAQQSQAKALAQRMVYSTAMAETMRSATGVPGEGIMRDLAIIANSLMQDNVLSDATTAASASERSTIQGFANDLGYMDALNEDEVRRRMTSLRENTQSINALAAADAPVGAGTTVGANVPSSSYTNALISGEFLQKFSDSRMFKFAAIGVGAATAYEVVRSATDRFLPGSVPASGLSSANTMPGAPILSSPQDPTFHADAMPNTNVARVSRSYGQKNTLNVSGTADRPIDFRGISSNFASNNGYSPNVQGSFSSNVNGTMSRDEVNTFLASKMNSAF